MVNCCIACIYKTEEIFSLREIPTHADQRPNPPNMTQTDEILHKKDVLHFWTLGNALQILFGIPGDEV